MYALISYHNEKYKPLGDLTWDENKLIYAKKHGYAAHCKVDNFITGKDTMTGFEKFYLIKQILSDHPEYEWVWWTGTDSMITNMTVKIEDRISDNYHFIISTDTNGINADSFLLRNSNEGREFIDEILLRENECNEFWDKEQRAIALLLGLPITDDPAWKDQNKENLTITNKWKDKVEIVPQKQMNAYNTAIYNNQSNLDAFGNDGTWRPGDWLIHWPGLSLERRIWLACFYRDYVIK